MEKYSKIYRDNLVNSVIPFWVKNSPDYENGGTYSCLDRNGNVYDTKKYIWPQGRSIWMFSKLYNELEKNEKYLEIAKLGVEFVEKNAIDSKGRYYFLLTQQGSPYFYQRKVYSAVFCMLGYLEYGKATKNERYLSMAVDLFWKIRDWVNDTSLLGRPVFESLPKTSGLADVIVLASMAIELANIEKKQEYLDVMTECLDKVWLHYYKELNIFIENVPLDGSDILAWPEGRLFNPGHTIEVVWFILHLLKFLPDEKLQNITLEILESSLEFGWDKQYGGLYYFMDIENKPCLQLEASMKLWWPHTETLYATMLAYKITGDSKWHNWHKIVHDYTFEHFVDREYGGWFGYCNRQGKLTTSAKGGNYKCFFHVPRALLMCYDLFK